VYTDDITTSQDTKPRPICAIYEIHCYL